MRIIIDLHTEYGGVNITKVDGGQVRINVWNGQATASNLLSANEFRRLCEELARYRYVRWADEPGVDQP